MPSLSEEGRLLQESAERLFARTGGIGRARRQLDAGRAAEPSIWRELSALGWLAVLLPEGRGGLGLGAREAVALLEEAGRNLLMDPIVPGMAAAAVLSRCTTAEAKRLLSGALSGDTVCLLADHADGAMVDAIRRTSGLEGTITAVVCGGEAADIVVIPSRCGRKVHVVDRHGAEVGVCSIDTVDGDSVMIISAGASAHAQWPLEDGAVAAGRDFLRLGYAAELAGVLDEALRRTLEYVTLRRQFGSAIGSFQAIQHRAASLLVEITACRRLVYEASRAFGSGQQTTGSLMAKARVSQAAPNVLHECVQFHGAMGFADESDIGLIFRRGIALAAAGGTAGECRTLLGQSENRSASRATW